MQHTALQVADYWIAAGGPRSRATEWVAISLGESSYDDSVVSSAGAIGLWQIMPFNAAPHGVTVDDLYNPLINARVAVAMSGQGTNCAAWDSCYANINASGRYAFLGWPEQGSADYDNLQVVSVQLGHDKLGGAVPPGGAAMAPAEAKMLAQMQSLASRVYPGLIREAIGNRMAIDATYRRGWKP